ncbi:MAG TPA: hypothetical protein VK665_15940 [Candidatus Elarobacter sp.]|nr:hypothetical protein [Candidatus Elarobacter sp.]
MDDSEGIKEQIASLRAPTEINCVDVEFGLDESGEPGVWIFLHVADGESSAYIAELARFARTVEAAILDRNDGRRWPYVNFLSP